VENFWRPFGRPFTGFRHVWVGSWPRNRTKYYPRFGSQLSVFHLLAFAPCKTRSVMAGRTPQIKNAACPSMWCWRSSKLLPISTVGRRAGGGGVWGVRGWALAAARTWLASNTLFFPAGAVRGMLILIGHPDRCPSAGRFASSSQISLICCYFGDELRDPQYRPGFLGSFSSFVNGA